MYGTKLSKDAAKQVCQGILFGTKKLSNDGYIAFEKGWEKSWEKDAKDISSKDLTNKC